MYLQSLRNSFVPPSLFVVHSFPLVLQLRFVFFHSSLGLPILLSSCHLQCNFCIIILGLLLCFLSFSFTAKESIYECVNSCLPYTLDKENSRCKFSTWKFCKSFENCIFFSLPSEMKVLWNLLYVR